MAQEVDVHTFWTGTTYAGDKGWNQLKIEGDTKSVFNYYMLDSTQWKSEKVYDIIEKISDFLKGINRT